MFLKVDKKGRGKFMETMERIKELNTRQFVLYEYLKLKSEKGLWTKREKILEDLSEYYNYNPKKSLYYNDAAKHLTQDIKAINDSFLIQKIILSNSYRGIKIANEEEADIYLSKEKAAILNKFKGYYNKLRKMKSDGQMRLTFNYERDVIEAFIKETGEIPVKK